MTNTPSPLTRDEKIKALLQIETAMWTKKHPRLRACGFTEETATILATVEDPEPIITLAIVADDGSMLDRCCIDSITDFGRGLLAQAAVEESGPLRVSMVPEEKAFGRRLFEATRSGTWDLIKIAFGAFMGACFTWWFKGPRG
jgi:hypothetical protein